MFMMIHDLKDPDDDQGRSYREVNNAKQHKLKIGQLVESANGIRLFIHQQTRDCDGTPLYVLATDTVDSLNNTLSYGYSERVLTEVKHV